MPFMIPEAKRPIAPKPKMNTAKGLTKKGPNWMRVPKRPAIVKTRPGLLASLSLEKSAPRPMTSEAIERIIPGILNFRPIVIIINRTPPAREAIAEVACFTRTSRGIICI